MDKNKLFVFLLTILLSIPPGPVFANSPQGAASAILTENWVYSAIADLGRGRPIPDFVISQEMTRNQGALMLARLLQYLAGEAHLESRRFGISRDVYLDSIITNYNQKAPQEQVLTGTQVETLYRLALEFQRELEILGYAIQDFNWLSNSFWHLEANNLFSTRPVLMYSEQAVAAVRKRENRVDSLDKNDEEILKSYVPDQENAAAPREIRNLWTGSFDSALQSLLIRNIFVAEQEQTEPGPSLQIGSLELSGGIRPVQSGTQFGEDLPLAEGGAAYGISVKYGDLALRTAVDHLALDQSQAKKIISTAVDLSLDWAELFTVNAGYKHIEGPQDIFDEDPVRPTTTSLGLEVPIPRGKVRLDVTQSWPKLKALSGAEDSGSESDFNVFLPKNTAELGLSYEFEDDSALRLNYKLIDFSNVEQNYGATAEFSIKF